MSPSRYLGFSKKRRTTEQWQLRNVTKGRQEVTVCSGWRSLEKTRWRKKNAKVQKIALLYFLLYFPSLFVSHLNRCEEFAAFFALRCRAVTSRHFHFSQFHARYVLFPWWWCHFVVRAIFRAIFTFARRLLIWWSVDFMSRAWLRAMEAVKTWLYHLPTV